jgi:hypothetical protein
VSSKSWLIVLGVGVLAAVIGGLYLGSLQRAGARTSESGSGSAPIAVDVFAAAPDRYPGPVTVSGSVTSADAPNHAFVLGCADACVAVPVQYPGSLPAAGAKVLVTGAVTKGADGKRVFVATDVSTVR